MCVCVCVCVCERLVVGGAPRTSTCARWGGGRGGRSSASNKGPEAADRLSCVARTSNKSEPERRRGRRALTRMCGAWGRRGGRSLGGLEGREVRDGFDVERNATIRRPQSTPPVSIRCGAERKRSHVGWDGIRRRTEQPFDGPIRRPCQHRRPLASTRALSLAATKTRRADHGLLSLLCPPPVTSRPFPTPHRRAAARHDMAAADGWPRARSHRGRGRGRGRGRPSRDDAHNTTR